ncbi:hypothetical protein H5410_058338, partial [Solanum commersonii]
MRSMYEAKQTCNQHEIIQFFHSPNSHSLLLFLSSRISVFHVHQWRNNLLQLCLFQHGIRAIRLSSSSAILNLRHIMESTGTQEGTSTGNQLPTHATGHIKDKCNRLHGFPPDFKFTKGKNAGTAAIANGFLEELMGDSCEKTPETGKGKMHEQSGQILTNQQFNQLVNLLEHMQIQ